MPINLAVVASGVDLGGVQVATYTDGSQGATADHGLGPHLVLSGDTNALNGKYYLLSIVKVPRYYRSALNS